MSQVRTFLTLALCSLCLSGAAAAAPARSTTRPAAAASRATHRRSSAVPSRSTAKAAAKTPAPAPASAPPEADALPPDVPDTRAPPSGVSEAKVAPATAPALTGVVKVDQADKGVKTYTFGAEEVEGRLKSPQILYFLRRVRAEFDAESLGHRSFLLELSDTRRHPSLE